MGRAPRSVNRLDVTLALKMFSLPSGPATTLGRHAYVASEVTVGVCVGHPVARLRRTSGCSQVGILSERDSEEMFGVQIRSRLEHLVENCSGATDKHDCQRNQAGKEAKLGCAQKLFEIMQGEGTIKTMPKGVRECSTAVPQ